MIGDKCYDISIDKKKKKTLDRSTNGYGTCHRMDAKHATYFLDVT